MKMRSALIAFALVPALSGCRKEGPATPLSLVPEGAMVSVVVTEPVAAVRSIDAYIAAGAPYLGAGVVEGKAAGLLELENLDGLGDLGLDPGGSLVFWMENMMPQSMAMGVSITDFPAFLSLMGRLGLTFQPGQPLDGLEVFQASSENGTIYAAQSRGVALLAMNRAKLGEMADALSREPAVETASGSVFLSLNIAMFGPMAASQIPMIAQAAASDPEMSPLAAGIMALHFDATVAFLNQTRRCDITLTFGPEEITLDQMTVFNEGSDLAGLVVTPDVPSLLDRIPAGEVGTAQMKFPPELAGIVLNSVSRALGHEMDPAAAEAWARMVSCTALSLADDGFMTACNMPEGADLQGVTGMISDMMGRVMAVVSSETDGVTVSCTPCVETEVQGVPMLTSGCTLLIPGEDGAVDTLAFNCWYTMLDGVFLAEAGDEPSGILQAASGDFSPASEIPGLNPDALGSYIVEAGGYLGMVRRFSPEESDIPENVPALWVIGELTADNGVLRSFSTVSGAELVSFAVALSI